MNGPQRVVDFVGDNPFVEFHPCDRTNDTALIRMNDGVVTINSALEVDLSGQVCADSIGFSIYSGIGGQMDCMRGAALSRDGRPVIALRSTAARSTVSRLVASLKPGAGVVTTAPTSGARCRSSGTSIWAPPSRMPACIDPTSALPWSCSPSWPSPHRR